MLVNRPAGTFPIIFCKSVGFDQKHRMQFVPLLCRVAPINRLNYIVTVI